MKKYAKLLVIAFVLAIFSVGAVAASENVTADTGDLTQVLHEQVVSVADPTVQEIETTTLETSGDDTYVNEVSSSSDDIINVTDSGKESLKVSKKESSLLGAANDEEILSTTRYFTGSTFDDLQRVINNAQPGDIIDLQGKTVSGYSSLTCNKDITLRNGHLDGNDNLAAYTFQNCKLEDLILSNFHMNWGASINYCTLNNVAFYNFLTDKGCTLAIRYCNLESVNFTNCHSLMPADPEGEDFETGVMIVTYGSNYNNCYFTNCSTNRHSGAICVAGSPGNTANITNCVFYNCSSGVGGAIYLHGTGLSEDRHSNIINCKFIECKATEYGGAIGSSQDYLNIENCDFYNNSAKRGGAIMVGGITHGLDGDNSEGHNNLLKDCSFFNNIASEEGGAVHITGDNNEAINCNFDDNFAHGGNGSAIYVHGANASVYDSNFTNHDCARGTVYIYGENSTIQGSFFENNTASKGGAGVYILGNNTILDDNVFNGNNATIHGGAIHTNGNNAIISNSVFTNNNALPNVTDKSQGLGGAIYIHGDNNLIYNSNFTGNTARNGSAIYNNGDNLTIEECDFINNQAWSYIIITITEPPSPMYYNETQKVKINLTMVGGDNIINAIHNAEDPNQIYLYNVTYYHSTTNTTRTTSKDEIHPRDGVENSEGGKYLYQDDREDLQLINVVVTRDSDDKVILNTTGEDLRTGLYGNLTVILDPVLIAGNYTIFAEHPADENYTAISNTTHFEIIPYVDVSVTKTSNKDVYIVGEEAIFTIVVRNVGSTATNVTVRDILPDSLTFVSAVTTQGTYNSTSNIWSVGDMTNGSSKTLTLTVKTTELGSFDNVVNVTSYEKDWNLSNNVANKTIEVNVYYDKEANVTNTSAGEYIEYYLNIYNVGDSLYNGTIQVRDTLPQGIKYTGEYQIDGADLVRYINYVDIQIWEITNISANSNARITIKAQALKDGVWNNTMNVWDYPEKNATVNVSSNADLQIIKSASVVNVSVGDVFNWTIIVINHGPSKAYDVYVDDLLPSGLQIVGHAIPSNKTSYNRLTGVWNIGELGVEDYVTLIIPTRVTQSGDNITNVAVVNSTTPDPDYTNNEDNDTVYFNPDVGIVKLVSTQSTSHGAIITWTLNVTNYGPNTATGVYVIDKLPTDSLRYINQTRTKGEQYNPVSGRWYIGTLEEGESAVLTINTRVLTYDGYISNNATVYATNDNNPDNNYAENFTMVDTEADVSIIKLVSNQTAHYGDEITWTLIVTNNGPSTAENVYVIDFLPSNLLQTAQPYITKGQIAHLGTNGLWTIGSLANGENATMIIYTKVMDSNTTIINVANVTTSTYDPDLSNNWDENGTYVPPECDVEVIKRVSNSTPNKNDEVTWTITVINHGRDIAENVVVTDVLPDGLEFVINTLPTMGSYSKDRNTWTVGNLVVNSRQNLTITTKVVDTGEITNEVNVSTSTYDTDETNNYDNETIDVPAIADLEITKLVSNKTPKYGDLINWTVTVTNNGPNNARHVVVTDKLPSGLIYITHNATTGLYDPSQGIWQIGDLLHFDNETLSITTRVNITNATITNIAVVTSTTPDPNPDNNEANNTTTVGPIADLAIDKTVNDHGPAKGDNITWTITVVNNGPDAAINAYVEDVIPNGLIFINATSEHGGYDNNTNIWTIGDIANGETRVLYIVTQVNVTKEVITNTANVTSDTEDSDLTNNEDNSTIDVGHMADLKIIKKVSNSTPNKGDVITWNITVINLGPDTAIEAYVVDVLPDGLVYQSDDSNGDYNPITGVWIIGDLAKDANVTLLIETLVNVSGKNITNIAVVDSDTDDPNPENNEDNDTIYVKNIADLRVSKIVNPDVVISGETVYWTVYVENIGPDTAINAYAVDILPKNLIFVVANTYYGKYNSTTGRYVYRYGTGEEYNTTNGVWTIGNMSTGDFGRLTLETIANSTVETTIINEVTVNSSTAELDYDNNYDYNMVDVLVLADLEITKEVSNKTPHAGDKINWTITVTNNGPSDAFNVNVTDKLPDGLVYQTDDSNGAYNATTGVWEIGNLTVGETKVLVITTLVNITNATITNVANVTSTTPDPDETNNKDNNTTKVDPEADLEIIKLVSSSTAKKGDVVTWTIMVTNKGPDTALNVFVRDELPSGLVLTKYSKTKGLFDSDSFTWFISKLEKGESQNLTLITLVNVTNKTLVNNVNVTNDVYDPNETNNEANNTTDVDPLANLVVVKEVSNKNPKYGETITWTVTVTNKGPDVAVNTKVTDKLPIGLIFVGSDGDYDETTGIWNVGNLTNGESRSLVITTLVNITNATIRNIANATSDTPGNDTPGNNTTDVGSIADLEILKYVSKTNVMKGDTVTWTIVVTNNGPDTAVNVKVTDKLPNGLIYQKDDSNGEYNPISGVWAVGDLEYNQSKILVITTLVNITNATIRNVANVTSDTPDNNDTNNEANNTTNVDPEADLEVIKTVSNSTPAKGDIIIWTLEIVNHGPDNSTRVVVVDVLPNGLVFVDESGNPLPGNRIQFEIPKINYGQSISVNLRTLVTISNINLTNQVLVASLEVYDPNQTNNYDNETIEVLPSANLVVEKFVSSNVTKTGDIITWTVVVTNNGPDTAVNTRVTDKLPDGLIYNGHKADTGNYDPETGVWIVGDLANGESKQLVISTIVNITNKTIVNVANVTSDTPGNKTNGTNNTTSAPKADLVVVKEVSNKNPKFGETVTWTVTVTNKGPDVAVNTKVTDKLPTGLIFVGSDGDYDETTGIWNVGNLTNGESRSLVITTLVNITNATIRNIANATSDTPGNDTPGNNTTDVGSIADLEVIKLVSNSTAKKGDIITWTIVVTNNGPDAAVNANVTDKLPAGLIYNGHKADKGVYDPSNGFWIIGDMAKGDVYKLVINTIVDISNGTIENIAVGNSSTPDNNTDNNKGNNTTTVNDDADLEIVKVVSNKNPHKGETITWTITVTNNGPSDAKNVKVTDKLPDGLIFAGSNGAYNPVTGEWTVGDLANGKSASLIITTIVNITNKNITNVANVTSDTPDSNKTNNEANNTTDVSPEADLAVIKTVSNSTPAKGDVITWTITVTNRGPDAAVNVTIFDEIPEGLLVIENGKVLTSRNITVFIPQIAAYQTTSFDFETLVNVTNRNITNVVVVNSTTYDPNETNNEDNETADVPAEADLGVVKLVSNATAHKGNVIIWTVIVTNHGPDAAENVYVNDAMPKDLVYKAHTTTKGLFDSNTLTWFIASLANGESQTLTISTEVNATNKTITNIVNVTSDTPDSNESNNVANNTTDVPPEADIGVVKEVNATECMKDQIVEWTITMTNHGPDGAYDVVVKDNLPDTLIFVSSDGNYDPETGIWTIDYLANGETRVLHIITKVNTTGMVIVNNVTVTSGVYDPDMSNNKANNSTVVKGIADLEISKVVSDSNPHKGDTITWTITVTNNGPDTAKDVKVTDKLPDGLVFVSADGNYDDETGIWTVGDLANGKTATLVIHTLVDFTNANVTNVAVVNSTTPDNNTDNNKDNDTTGVDPEADISVIKTVSNPNPSTGDLITWTIVVTNFGPDMAENVYVEEFIPEGLRLISARGSKGSFLNEIWTIGDLSNGETATLTLTTRVLASSGTIENIVIAHTSTYDPDETNNRDNEVAKVKKASTSADLELTKVANKNKVKVGDIIIWTITVINHGPDKAVDVYVQDILDAGDAEFISAKASVGEFDEENGIWKIGDMENGERVTLIVIFKALSEGEVTNYAEVISETPDPNFDNNYDYSTVQVVKDVPDPDSPNTPKTSTPTMHATGNPIVMVLLALLAIAGVSLRRKY